MSKEQGLIRTGFGEDYRRIFVDEWSPYMGAILLVMVILGMNSWRTDT